MDILLNAGAAGSAWSGGEYWHNSNMIEKLTQWIYDGGIFVGIEEPSAVEGNDTFLRMSHVLGVDLENSASPCRGQWSVKTDAVQGLIPDGVSFPKSKAYLTRPTTRVLAVSGESPALTIHNFGSGNGIYLSGFETNMLSAIFPKAGKLVLINNSEIEQKDCSSYQRNAYEAILPPYGMKIIEVNN